MDYISTNNQASPVSFREAVIKGLAEDGGLYMPTIIKNLEKNFVDEIGKLSYAEIGLKIANCFIEDEIEATDLSNIVEGTLNFELPVVEISDTVSTLELFHGPTLAFKDVGARFMARCLGHFAKNNDKETTVLVATSGDTGSAVAHGFYGVEGIRVVILYPKGKISEFQENQMTRLGKNITALEVNGNFDDCQKLVKSAFSEKTLTENILLTSANSINIARLVPQIFYYFIGFSQLNQSDPIVSVPSGNYGNLTAGLIAKRMGLPVRKFVASSNRNDIVPNFLQTGEFKPQPSIATISNAMDVGNPSNFARMMQLYNGSKSDMSNDVLGFSFTDSDTRNTIYEVREKYGYILDPHGAVGYLGLKKAQEKDPALGIFLETAHPAKFREVVEPVLEEKIKLPQGYQVDTGVKLSIPMENQMSQLEEILLQ